MRRLIALAIVASLVLAACSPQAETAENGVAEAAPTTTTTAPSTTTTLPAFAAMASWQDGEPIPIQFTCDGSDISPQIDVVGIPADTTALAILADDPDAPLGVWDHWVEFDIAVEPGTFQLAQGAAGTLGTSGVNSWNVDGYMGPCPPEGEEHTYVFTVYALDDRLDLPTGVDSDTVRKAMAGLIVAQAEVTGTYARP